MLVVSISVADKRGAKVTYKTFPSMLKFPAYIKGYLEGIAQRKLTDAEFAKALDDAETAEIKD